MTKNKKPEVQSTDKSQKCIMQNKFVLASFLIAMLGSLIHNIYPQATSTAAFQLLTLFSLKNYPLFNNFFNTKIQLNNNLHQIIESMVKTADKPLQKYKVAVGYGSCADIFTDALPLFKKVGINSPASALHHNSIDSKEELAQVFTYFFQEGAAAERYISDIELFDKLVDNVPKNDKYALGGNAPVMANRLAKEQKDSEILLAAQHSHEFKDWMDSRVKFTGPETSVADRHLILEYKTGDKFDGFLSPRANRFIVHSDQHNPDIRGLDESFGAAFDEMDPNLLVISGLQMMDNFPYQNGKQSELIDDMANFCKEHREVKTHFELASFVDTELVQEIIQKLMPYKLLKYKKS